MANFKITCDDNSITNPLVLGRGTGIADITSVNCYKHYVWCRDNLSNCTKLTSFKNVKLMNTNCSSLFLNCSALTDVSLSYVSAFTKADSMFKFCVELKSATPKSVGSFSSVVDGYAAFSHCHTLTSFTNDLSNLVDGRQFVNECYELTSFNATLPKVENGWGFFRMCRNLSSFPTDYPELINSEEMFEDCQGLVNVNFNMPKLTNTKMMFKNCHNLKTYSGNLSNVQNNAYGDSNSCGYMFNGCENLDEVNITTDSENEALFTKLALGIRAAAVLRVNGKVIE